MPVDQGARLRIWWIAGLYAVLASVALPSASHGITFQAVEEDYTISLGGQYRVRVLDIEPIKLNGPKPFNLGYASQRLRTDLTASYKDKVSVKCQLNILDGVVMGDNGVWGDLSTSELGLPLLPNEGVKTSALVPNNGRIGIGLIDPGMNPINPNSYGPVFLDADPIQVTRIWGEVMLPFGMLRAGRQPATLGKSILVNDGDGLTNEFGVSKFGDTVDRVLIGTKPLEIYKVIKAGMDTSVANDSIEEGMIAVIGYDFLAFNSITDDGEDVQQIVTALFYREPRFSLFGMEGEGLEFRLGAVYRFGEVHGRYFRQRQMFVNGVLRTIDEEVIEPANIGVTLMTGGMSFDLGSFFFDLELSGAYGYTEEVPKTINLISPGFYPSDRLKVRAWGAQVNMGCRVGNWEFALEVDYATGDDDPKDDVASEFMFAEDTNVGLLLFEEVISFERAQSAAAGTWNILNSFQALGRQPPSNPSSRVATNGAFHNAIAVLPKVTYRFTDNLYVRTGVLAAWADKDVIDPVVMRTMAGNPRVNFNGGEPAKFYGVEVLGRLEWWVWNHFVFNMEGAYLMPGAALEDENGRALDAWMWEARMTFVF